MTTAFTPGPWRVTAELNTNVIRGPSTNGALDSYIATTWGGEHDANARLIAAAPELLAAVQAFIKYDADEGADGAQWMLNYEAARTLALEAFAKATQEAAPCANT